MRNVESQKATKRPDIMVVQSEGVLTGKEDIDTQRNMMQDGGSGVDSER